MSRMKPISKNEDGFTIVELLIATVVFAMVMLVLMVGVIQISNSYYKGITESNTQNTARNVLNDIAQAIQFSGGDVTTPPLSINDNGFVSYAFCVNSNQYSYLLGYEVKSGLSSANSTTNQSPHAMVVNPTSGCPSATPQKVDLSTINGKDLIGQNMRLANLTVTQMSGNFYSIDVRIVYGDSDLLNNPNGTNASCKGKAGDQFCAAAELNTIVQKRVGE